VSSDRLRTDADNGQLRGTAESNWEKSSPDAAADVHLRSTLGIPAFYKTSRPARQPEDWYEPEVDLAAMRVSCEHKRYAPSDVVKERGCVERRDHIGTLWDSAEGCV